MLFWLIKPAVFFDVLVVVAVVGAKASYSFVHSLLSITPLALFEEEPWTELNYSNEKKSLIL